MKGMELYRDEALVFGHLDAVLVTVMRGALTAVGPTPRRGSLRDFIESMRT
ncbi:MAG: hypothetical protein RLO52_45150 [Sandaracinaceae bacterium]